MTQNKNANLLGMWTFLASEVLFFSMLLLTYAIYSHLHPEAFHEGVRHQKIFYGTLNTAVLLTSSWTMACAVRRFEEGRKWKLSLVMTLALGVLFLMIKGFEYFLHFQDRLFPGLRWNSGAWPDPSFKLYFDLYFLMTSLHALHLMVGLLLGAFALLRFRWRFEWRFRWHFERSKISESWIQNMGLYWHFVDIVWVFLFPALYLIGRTP